MHKNNSNITLNEFSFSFDGENEIEASLLGLSLSNISFIVNQIAASDNSLDECRLKVTAFQKGSFEVLFTFVTLAASQITALYTPEEALVMFNILKGVFDIKKCLKGDKPKSIEEDPNTGYMHVVAPDGSDVFAPLGSKVVIANSVVDRKVSEIGNAAHLHNPNGGFRLASGDSAVRYEKEDVEDILIETHEVDFSPTDTERSDRLLLPIRKVDLLGNASWSFKYGSRSITAKIEDASFIKAVHSGETSYKAGDKLDVSLTTLTKLSGDGVPMRETYTIDKVYGHVSAAEQMHF